MNKSRKKLLMSSMAMLIVAAMALSTATYAWFTASDNGQVTEIEFTATASQGIQLSADAVNWKSILPIDEIKDFQTKTTSTANFSNADTENHLLKPLSTDGTLTGGVMNLFNGVLENDGTLTTTLEPTNGAFYRFDVYVKNDGASEQTLYLDLGNSVVEDKEEASTGIEKAVRIAFIDQGQGEIPENGTQTEAIVRAASAGSESLIWEPNAASHNSYATTYRYQLDEDGKPKLDTKIAGTSDIEDYVGIAAAASKLPVSGGAAVPKDDVAVLMSTVDDVTVATDASGTVKIATLQPNMVSKLTIYIWLEGQDVDCNNQESGGTVQTMLQFTTTAASGSGSDTPSTGGDTPTTGDDTPSTSN